MTDRQQRGLARAGEWFRFGLIGALATLTYLVVSLLTDRLGTGPYTASLAGYLASVGISYFGHGRFTFRTERPYSATGPRFLVVTLSVFALTNLLVFIVTDLLERPFFVATIVIAICIPVATWAMSRFWVFGAPKW